MEKYIKRFSLLAVLALGVGFLGAFVPNIILSQTIAAKNAQEAPEWVPKSETQISDRRQLLEEMHKMANSEIIADEIWGEEEITSQRCNELLRDAESLADQDLIVILHEWASGEYHHMVDQHNYIWKELGGDVGFATGLRE